MSPPPRYPSSDETRFVRDERGVSTALSYVLSLAITSILISGLMLAAGGFVEGQREEVIRSELEVVGQTLVADTEGTDRLASAISGDIRVKSTLPRRVGSSAYTINITNGPFPNTKDVTLTASSVDVSVTLLLVTNNSVENGAVDGGELVIVYPNANGKLEVRNR